MDFEDDIAALNGRTSLAFLQAVYCNDGLPLHTRLKAAIAALPYEHPKLAVTMQVTDEGLVARLNRAIERSAKVFELRMQQAQPMQQAGPMPAQAMASEVSAAAMRRPMAQLIRRR